MCKLIRMSFEKRILLSPFWSVNIIAVWREPSGLSGLSGSFGLFGLCGVGADLFIVNRLKVSAVNTQISSLALIPQFSALDPQHWFSVLGPQFSALSADQHDVLNFGRRSPRFPAMRSGVAIFMGLTSGVFPLL